MHVPCLCFTALADGQANGTTAKANHQGFTLKTSGRARAPIE